MRCFARWRLCPKTGLAFRDQTVLQFGDRWDLLASFVLLNPGSALPATPTSATDELRGRSLPYVEDSGGEDGEYFEFRLDPLMRYLLKGISSLAGGGAIRIYNLFNLRKANAGAAIRALPDSANDKRMFDEMPNVRFLDAPVVFACGKACGDNSVLKEQLARFLSVTSVAQRYGIVRIGERAFSVEKIEEADVSHTYHPSYSCARGNATTFHNLPRTSS